MASTTSAARPSAKGKGIRKGNRLTQSTSTRGKVVKPSREKRERNKKASTRKPPGRISKPEQPERPEGTSGKNFVRDINPATGFVHGSDADVVATLLLEGDTTRQDIIDKIKNGETPIDVKTKTGGDKPISNLVSTIYRKMIGAGYRLDSHYRLLPPEKTTPTPRNARKAERASSKKSSTTKTQSSRARRVSKKRGTK